MTISRWLAVAVLVLVAGVSVGATLLISDDNGSELPPGCTPQDRETPGCRPTNTGTGSNTVALVTVILTPLAALAVALIAAGSARDRLREQLDAEADREETRLEHERRMHDLDGLRGLIDDAAEAMQTRTFLLHDARRPLSGKSGPVDPETEDAIDDAVRVAQDYRSTTLAVQSRLLVHFDRDSELYTHYFGYMESQDIALNVLWDESLDAEERLSRSEAEVPIAGEHFGGFRDAANLIIGYRLPE